MIGVVQDPSRRVRPALLAIALALAIGPCGLRAEDAAPAPLAAADGPHPLVKLLADEAREVPELAPLVAAQREEYDRSGPKHLPELLEVLASLRYVRMQGLSGQTPYASAAMEPVPLLVRNMNEALARCDLPPIECDRASFREIAQTLLPPTLSGDLVNPYFRTAVSRSRVRDICNEMNAAIDKARSVRRFFLADQPEVPARAREAILARYRYQMVRDCVVWPLMREASEAVSAEMQRVVESSGMAAAEADGGEAPPVPPPPAPQETSEFGQLNESLERLYGIMFSLIPALLAGEDEPNQSATLDVGFRLLRPPHSQLRTSVSVVANKRWWVLLFNDFESSDGTYAGEHRLVSRCFAFDRTDHRLFLYDPDGDELRLASEAGRNPIARGFYLLRDYQYGDVHAALNAANALCRFIRADHPVQDEAVRNELRDAFGYSEAEISMLEVSSGRVAIPRIVVPYGLSVGLSGSGAESSIPAQTTLFPGGADICVAPQQGQPQFEAAGRLQVSYAWRASESVESSGEEPGPGAVEGLTRELLFRSLSYRVREATRLSAGLSDALGVEASLESLRHLKKSASQSRSAALQVNDFMIGHLFALSRTAEGVALLGEQARLLENHPDREYTAEYFDFYKALSSGPPPRDPMRVRCFFLSPDPPAPAAGERRLAPDQHGGLLNGALRRRAALAPGESVEVAPRLRGPLAAVSDPNLHSYLEKLVEELVAAMPRNRVVDRETADEVERAWRGELERMRTADDPNRRVIIAVTAAWQIYHICLASREPLAEESAERKRSQIESLAGLFDRLPILIEDWGVIDDGAREALAVECVRSKARLLEYASSRSHPFLYYPLNESAFRAAFQSIESRMGAEVETLREKLLQARRESLRGELDRVGGNSDLDLFLTKFRTAAALHMPTLSSLTLGNVVRQYGIVERKIDYKDREMFPFGATRGLSLVYQMQGGLFTELHVEWTLSAP